MEQSRNIGAGKAGRWKSTNDDKEGDSMEHEYNTRTRGEKGLSGFKGLSAGRDRTCRIFVPNQLTV